MHVFLLALFAHNFAGRHDETDNTYAEQLDQTTLGHRFVLSQFNVTPRTTWQVSERGDICRALRARGCSQPHPRQIDPWGHTAFQATYMSSPLAGFNAVYYGRIDWQAKRVPPPWLPCVALPSPPPRPTGGSTAQGDADDRDRLGPVGQPRPLCCDPRWVELGCPLA